MQQKESIFGQQYKNKQFHIWFKDCFEKHIESIMDHASKPTNIFN